ncbi:PRC and DUF2382 domain-containing protein [Streptosporangium sp. NPDC023615]|uniref:PRC and DUF2382 domain-containing protein n=1 Tax=Streptosporangium sp. NPDC023615 TaxID=3154794 RepID=UPI003428D044
MITKEQIPMVIDHQLYDSEGQKVGEVKHVYLDDSTGKPEWLCVKTGLFGMKETFVPIQRASLVGDHVEVEYDKARIKDAPNVDVESGGHLSQEEERRLYEYYGVSWGGNGGPGMGDRSHAGMRGGTGRGDTMSGSQGRAGRAPVPGPPGGTRRGGENTMNRPQGRSGHGDDAMTRSEEKLDVGTESHETGRARLRKYVVTEEEQVTVPVTREEVRIEREPVTDANRADAMSGSDITEAEHEVTLHAERPVVTTEAVPVEQIRMSKEQVTEQERVSGKVRKERVEVDLDGEGDGRPGRDH